MNAGIDLHPSLDKHTKVSVIVASYNSGKGLFDLIASLDAQTMPRGQWEAIFVDDGSTDGTYDTLRTLQRTRDYLRVVQIPNSGWPCRPRNTGLELATGEYVVFSDHDDVFYPEALEHGYNFAVSSCADIVNGREARTNQYSWAVNTYSADRSDTFADKSRFPLTPMNPHKLYRRSLLMEHNIRFRDEGRVLWEDKLFNLAACRHTTRIATLSSTPFYHWVDRGESTSSTFRRSRPDWWHWLTEVFKAAHQELAAPEWDVHRDHLILAEYRNNLLGSFNQAFPNRDPEEQQLIFDQARAIQREYVSERFDAMLNPLYRLRADLLREGHFQGLSDLSAVDAPLVQTASVGSAEWTPHGLTVTVDASWHTKAPQKGGLILSAERAVLPLPATVFDTAGTSQLDLTSDLLVG